MKLFHYSLIHYYLIVTLTMLISFPVYAGIEIEPEQNIRTALIIGNGQYAAAPLKNPENDAIDMADLLRECDFSVDIKTNVTKRQMEEAIQRFGRTLQKGGIGLFYYAGHGMQVEGRNYMIPVEARIETESDVKYEAVDAGKVLGKMEDAGNDLNIVILDACRNNPYARSFRSVVPGLARMDAPKGSFISYSTAPGSVSADGEGRNGIFTKHLVENIKIPGLKIEDLFKRVRIAVLKETNEKQIPWESSSLTGNFIFNRQTNKNTSKRVDSHSYETSNANGISLFPGWWDPWQENNATSRLLKTLKNEKVWSYTIPAGVEENHAGLNIFIESYSLENRKIHIQVQSKSGFPLHLRLYSFVPGYSKAQDDATYLPMETTLALTPGNNDIIINTNTLKVPEWWMEEHQHPGIDFNWTDIRILEFSAEFSNNPDVVSDTIIINKIKFIDG